MAIAYGSITLVDIGDLGQLSVVPESNQPSTVIYDPNAVSAQQYNPDWNTSNLILTPVIYYGGSQKFPNTDAGLTVTWKRKIGSEEADLINTEVVSANGKLTVKSNQFTGNTSQITYICTVTYSDPATMGGHSLTARGQITFSLIKNASKVKSASITGESVYLYDASSKLVNTTPIKLTANLNALNMVGWGYKKNKIWNTINTTSTELEVGADSEYFDGDIATIKVFTEDSATGEKSDITDIHVITKIKDGIHGDQVISVVLTNENQMIPCDSDGEPLAGAFNNAKTTISIYEGSTDVTDEWTIEAQPTSVTGTWNDSTNTYTATSLSTNIGYVTFTCTPAKDSPYNSPVHKKFNLTKIQPGKDGQTPVTYSLDISTLVVNKNIAGNYSPSTLTIKAWSKTGTEERKAYLGRFKISNGSTVLYTSNSNESSYSYTNDGKTPLTIELYEAEGTTKLLDSQTVVTVLDGQTGKPGQTGASGKDAISFILGNYQDVIPCTNAGLVAAAQTIIIPFAAYKGGARVVCNAAISTLPQGMASTITGATTSADGKIQIAVSKGANLGGTNILEGKITITLTAEGTSNTQTYSWVKNNQAADGDNAVLFQIYAPNGNVIANGENSVLLKTSLVDGATTITSGDYQWAKWNGSAYTDISGAEGEEYEVQGDEVQSHTSYRCTVTYGGKDYEAFLSVYDKTDPLQIQPYCTLGDKIVNSVGQGLIYALVYRNGQELDPMKTLAYGTTLPSASNGDYFYHLDTTAKTATLKKYTGSKWTTVTSVDSGGNTGTYVWTLRDGENNIQGTKNGKAIYVDASVIDKKMTFDVEVTI